MLSPSPEHAGVGRLPRRLANTSVFSRTSLIQWTVFVVSIGLVALPIGPIIYQSFIDRPLYDAGKILTLKNYIDLFTNPAIGRVALNTFLFAGLTTVFAQVLGTAFAILVGRTNLPGRRLLANMLLWPLFLSQIVLGSGWSLTYGGGGFLTIYYKSLFGPEPWSLFSIPAMAVIAGVSQMPLSMLYCLGSLALADASLEDAARVCGAKPGRVLMRITMPLLKPAILYGAVLNFTIALETLSIPLMFGEPGGISVFTTFLYTRGLTAPNPNYGLIGTAAVILLAIIAVLIFVQRRMLAEGRRFVTVGGKATRPKRFQLGSLKWPAFAAVTIYLALFVLIPIAILTLRSFVKFLTPFVPFWHLLTFDFYSKAFLDEPSRRSILNTVFLSTVGAVAATFLAAMVAIVTNRSDFRYRRALEYIALFPRALPGIVAGIGFFYAVVYFPPLNFLKNTVWLMMIVYTMRYIPTGYAAVAPTLMQIAPDLDRSARVVGADWWTATRVVILKLMKPALVTGYALLFVSFVKEYSIAVFLFGPGSEVLGAQMLYLWMNGWVGEASALSVIQIVFTVVVVYLVQKVLGVKLYG